MPTYRTSPPGKLNLFLEILGKRDDGFHELDTVMVAIDLRDELSVRPIEPPEISLSVDWLPSRSAIADELGVASDASVLDVPADPSNLVHRALDLVNQASGYRGGWEVGLGKRIPAGAGMGGASSDAAATLRLAAAAIEDLARSPASDRVRTLHDADLKSMAEQLGSDVPFFLNPTSGLARARGRGEKLQFFDLPRSHEFVVVYPGVALSTAEVYRNCHVSDPVRTGDVVIDAFCNEPSTISEKILYNALQSTACGLSPQVGEALHWLADTSSNPCLMTGSGSASFVWLADPNDSGRTLAADLVRTRDQRTNRLSEQSGPEAMIAEGSSVRSGGALIRAVSTCMAASEILIA
ncbi:4-(cytidine 5'-diphospho)-2-C-methyl-D-erythritol kinase [Neorhodopirellula pilleata]|uniref:4-diphosphocytidyl-2-C-methyl-D-erythritol kinase n=1 Tax=Neorhodopirellula pilleata TaxID=2714738 RepID=A0A5C5ZXE1_9BACT|nr:4-(cytidine 5'-diphospho)-2-C-methyl-D-erythritol kinase [Neorhodopirellula pilleata]TWT91810.1 4-diphosphocytidyl-2-C-methyl-D-erythritol kinase [Neorhodopirellula pilleata]